MPDAAHDVLGHAAQPAELRVGEPVPLGPAQQVGVELGGVPDLGGDLVEQRDLVEEPRVDAGRLVHLVDGRAGQQRLLHHAAAARRAARRLAPAARLTLPAISTWDLS